VAVKRRRKAAAEHPRSVCPIANALDILGDKWTLLVVRDILFFGKRRYGELAASPEGIPSNLLAERLKRLEGQGLVTRHAYQDNPVRYEYRMTGKGRDLYPVLREMVRWGNRHVPGTFVPPPVFFEGLDKKALPSPAKPGRRRR
jgi:DNA-binding HxlR family transcriptional regulator